MTEPGTDDDFNKAKGAINSNLKRYCKSDG